MKVKILKECGYEESLNGVGLSFGVDDFERLEKVAKTLAPKDGGHNKFLESMMVWIEITAPRYWWAEQSTYRVGTSNQSECYDDITEVLTDGGWKLFKDVVKDKDKVFTMDISTYTSEFQNPTSYIEQDYNGEMICIKARSIDLVVTPEHNMVIKRRRSKKLSFKKAIDFTYSNCIPKYSIWNNTEVISYFSLPGLDDSSQKHDDIKIDMNLWLSFMGLWLSEGYVAHTKSGGYKISICQIESSPFIEDIDYIFNLLPFKVNRTINKSSSNPCVIWSIYNKQLYTYLLPMTGSSNKYIPRDLLSLPANQLSILNEWLMRGDGNRTNNHYIYISTSKRLIDDVQELWTKMGSSSNNRTHRITIDNCKTVYSTARHRTKFAYPIKNSIKTIHYQGKVYCLDVPNHTLLVRRNGTICWSGNSTIHTLCRTKVTQDNFEEPVLGSTIKFLNECIDNHNSTSDKEKKAFYFRLIKMNLPEGYLQKRLMCTNYKTLKNIVAQRKNHKLQEWHTFIDVLKNQLQHPEFIFKED